MRKLTGYYLDGETQERKAFGIIAGYQNGAEMNVAAVFPLLVNLRQDPVHQASMDEIVDSFAIASQTPNAQRGWIASPSELLRIEQYCDAAGLIAFGNYHTHRVAWPHDPLRDTCTQLDRMLADGCGQWTFIVSAVDLHRPLLRAFYEGHNEREAKIRLS